MFGISGTLRSAVVAACFLLLSVTKGALASEPTPTQCAPVLFRSALMMFEAAMLSSRGDPSKLQERLKGVFQTMLRQMVFERMATRDDRAGLDAAWQRRTSMDEIGQIGGACITLYNSYRSAGRIDTREEEDAVRRANEWLRAKTASPPR